MKNRYTKSLVKNNQIILALVPANEVLRLIVAFELQDLYKTGGRVLEVGCGEGDSAKPILEHTKASLDLLDVSKEMITLCKKNLRAFSARTQYICKDALVYLKSAKPYNIIFSEWTVHNFPWKDKEVLFHAIYENLKPGGSFILMDKVYPEKGAQQLLEQQIERYRRWGTKGAGDIIEHEKQDYTDAYRMDEKRLIAVLKKTGFTSVVIKDRVERDVVLVATK